MSKTDQIRQALTENPNADVSKLAIKFAIAHSSIYKIRKEMKICNNCRQEPCRCSDLTKVHESLHTITTIRSIKMLANEIGGLQTLKELVEAMS